jgi:hypothetical protein
MVGKLVRVSSPYHYFHPTFFSSLITSSPLGEGFGGKDMRDWTDVVMEVIGTVGRRMLTRMWWWYGDDMLPVRWW